MFDSINQDTAIRAFIMMGAIIAINGVSIRLVRWGWIPAMIVALVQGTVEMLGAKYLGIFTDGFPGILNVPLLLMMLLGVFLTLFLGSSGKDKANRTDDTGTQEDN